MMAKSPFLVVGLSLLAATSPTLAQTSSPPLTAGASVQSSVPQARALLEGAVERHRVLKNWTVVWGLNSYRQRIQFSAPATVKATAMDGTGQMLYSPGQIVTLKKIDEGFEYTLAPRPPLLPGQDGRSQLTNPLIGGRLFPLLTGFNPFGEGGQYWAASYSLGTPTVVEGVALIPVIISVAKASAQSVDLQFTVFIGNTDQLVHRVETKSTSADGQVMTLTDIYKEYQFDSAFPTGTFDFVPPQGAVKVSEFSQPTLRAKVGAFPLALPAGTKDTSGKTINFDQFRGKVVLVDFWATWCGPCVAALPDLQRAYNKYHARGFDVIGVSLDQSAPELVRYTKEKGLPWRQIHDGFMNHPITTSYNIPSVPTTLLIGKDGRVAAIDAPSAKLESAIQAALAAR